MANNTKSNKRSGGLKANAAAFSARVKYHAAVTWQFAFLVAQIVAAYVLLHQYASTVGGGQKIAVVAAGAVITVNAAANVLQLLRADLAKYPQQSE